MRAAWGKRVPRLSWSPAHVRRVGDSGSGDDFEPYSDSDAEQVTKRAKTDEGGVATSSGLGAEKKEEEKTEEEEKKASSDTENKASGQEEKKASSDAEKQASGHEEREEDSQLF